MAKRTGKAKTEETEDFGESCAGCSRRPPGVEGLLLMVAERLQQESKASVSDYIRLLELQKELRRDETKEVRVQWVESKSDKPESANEQ